MTYKNQKIILFTSLIAVMILPFTMMDVSAITQDADKKTTKTDKLQTKLENVASKISKVKENIAKLKEKHQRGQEVGNDDRVKKIEDKLANHQQKLAKLEAKYEKIKAKLSAKKDQISTTKFLLEKTENRINTLKSKISQAESDDNSERVDMLSEKLAKSQKRHIHLTDRLNSQYSQDNEDAVVVGYTVSDIASAFDLSESFVTFNENTMHMQVDVEKMKNDPNVSSEDIVIIEDFALVNDKMMDTFFTNDTPTDAQVERTLMVLESEKFHNLFDPVDDGTIHPVTGYENSKIIFATYDIVDSPVLSAFDADESEIVEVKRKAKKKTLALACGGYGMSNPHPDIGIINSKTGFSSLYEAQRDLLRDGYHQVPSYATFSGEASRPYDYAKVVSSGAPGNCNRGEFRDQAIIDKTSYKYSVYGEEPNPEILSYIWPGLWWPSYVQWWHANF